MPAPDYTIAAQHVALLTGSADTPCCFRLLRGAGRGWNLSGKLVDLWSTIETRQFDGWQIFIVVNDGGHKGASISRVRAFFVDRDGTAEPPASWHAEPDFLVHRDRTHWHAYWLVANAVITDHAAAVKRFADAQKRLAAHYGTDPTVHDLPRVMRLAGTLHLKDPTHPLLVTVEPRRAGPPRIAEELLAGIAPLPASAPRGPAKATGEPVSIGIVSDMLGVLDPGCDRGEWLRIVTAIRAAPVPGDDDESERRRLAHEWSVQAANYTGAEDVDRVFDDMEPAEPGVTGKIRFATLVTKARAAGYRGPISIAEQRRDQAWATAIAAACADLEATCNG